MLVKWYFSTIIVKWYTSDQLQTLSPMKIRAVL